jgi:hypothetical protein
MWYCNGRMPDPEVNKLMDSHEILHIAINPPVPVDANITREAAAVLNKELNEMHLLLTGNIPRIIAHYQSIPTAEEAARRLKSLGITVIVFRDSELRQHSSPIFMAHSLKFGQGEILFQDKRGTARTIKTGDVFLIIKGMAQLQTEKTVTKTKKKLNLPATLLTGGIPIQSKVEEQTTETSLQREFFVRLYHRNSPAPEVEITQHSFNYSCLGAEMSATTPANFHNLTVKIKEFCPQAIFDDRLTRYPMPGISPGMSPTNNNLQCKLIYLFHEIAST